MLSRIKRHGALLAKSRVVGAQFEALFTTVGETPLYLEIGRHAVDLAMRLRRKLSSPSGSGSTLRSGWAPYIDSPTNQQFFIVPNADLEHLRQHIGFEVWCPADELHTVCRFVTSWASTEEEIEELERLFT